MVPLQRSPSPAPPRNLRGRKTSPCAPTKSISSAPALPATHSTTGPAPNANFLRRTASPAASQPRNQKPPSQNAARSLRERPSHQIEPKILPPPKRSSPHYIGL